MAESSTKVVPSICLSCHNRCGILNYVDDEGKIVKVTGNPEFPTNQGFACVKGRNAWRELIYDPTRVLYPQKRVGKRGEGKWERISWDEALNTIAEEFHKITTKYGGTGVCCATNNQGFHYTAAPILLTRMLGSPNVIINQDICHGAIGIVDRIMFGGQMNHHYQMDYRNANTIVIAGHNLTESYPPEFNEIMRAKKRGAKVIVIDPRLTGTAKEADIWLQIKPTTDAALALGILNVIISEQLYDRDFVENWTNGPMLVRTDTRQLLRESEIAGGNSENFVIWDSASNKAVPHDKSNITWAVKPALKGHFKVKLADGEEVPCTTAWQLFEERVLEYPVETVSPITGISKDVIIEVARLIATNRPTSIRANRFQTYSSNVVTVRLFALITTLVGSVDAVGGHCILKFPGVKTQREVLALPEFKLPDEINWRRIGAREYPLWSGADEWSYQSSHNPSVINAILTSDPYPVRALYTSGYNHLITFPGCDKNLEAYMSLDFHVCCTHNMTPTAQIADIVLPKTYEWEEEAMVFHRGAWCSVAGIMPKVVEPPGECWDDYMIAHEIGEIMVKKGYVKRNFIPWKNSRELSDYLLSGGGFSFDEAKKKGFIKFPELYYKYKNVGFDTPSGKVEIFSSMLQKYGYDPLMTYEPMEENEESKCSLTQFFPLLLHTGLRHIVYHQARYRNHSWARKITPDPELEIHPKDAKERGIEDGDWVNVITPYGTRQIILKAKVTGDAYPGFVMTLPSWWYPEENNKEGWFRSNSNAVMSYGPPYDRINGTPNVRHVRCQVTKA